MNFEIKMRYTDPHFFETYSKPFKGLKPVSKIELIDKLTKSLEKEKKSKDAELCKSFGAFDPDKTAEEVTKEKKAGNLESETKSLNSFY